MRSYGQVLKKSLKNSRKKETMIGNMDLLIASHAKSLNAMLVTNNIREFERIEGLSVENWV